MCYRKLVQLNCFVAGSSVVLQPRVFNPNHIFTVNFGSRLSLRLPAKHFSALAALSSALLQSARQVKFIISMAAIKCVEEVLAVQVYVGFCPMVEQPVDTDGRIVF